MKRRDLPTHSPTRGGLPWFVCVAIAALVACSDTEPTGNPGDTGVDVSACPGAQTLCGDQCVDLDSDPQHCGTCTSVCDSTEMCVDSACSCPDGFDRCGVACRDTQNDPQHCGGCGLACGTDEDCVDGACALRCGTGLTACLDGCVDTTVSDDHCGGCDQPCVASENEVAACEDGTCARGCRDGWYDLDGSLGCEYFCDPDVPGDEICDGQDNDCDGEIDDADPDYVTVLCPRQDGVCNGAVAACVDGELVDCDAAVYDAADPDAPYSEGFEQWCDGLDNDCSGLADEDCCTAADMPLQPGVGTTLPGWTSNNVTGLTSFPDAPRPIAIGSLIGQKDGETHTGVAFLEVEPSGGPTRIRPLDVGLGGDGADHFASDWTEDDRIVTYMRRTGETGITRIEFELDGSEVAANGVVLPDDVDEEIVGMRIRSVGSGREIALLAMSPPGSGEQRMVYAEFADGTSTQLRELSALRSFVNLADVVLVEEGAVACGAVGDEELPLRCWHVRPESLTPSTFDANFYFGIQRPFVRLSDGSAIWYVADPMTGALVRNVVITLDGDVSLNTTALRTWSGFVFAGHLPDGTHALTTVIEVDSDLTGQLTFPETGTSVAATFAPDVLPLGFMYGGGTTLYVVPTSVGLDSRSPWAFAISQDNEPLCVE